MRSAFALRIISGRTILNFGVQKRLRAFLNPIFTDGVVTENGICSAAFCESAALWRGYLFAFSMLNPLRLTFVRQLPRRGSFLQ